MQQFRHDKAATLSPPGWFVARRAGDPAGATVIRAYPALWLAILILASPSLAFMSPTLVKAFGSRGSGYGQLDEPAGLVIDDDGMKIYVADKANDRVVAYSTDGDVLWRWGDYGHLNKPWDIAFANEMIFVANTFAHNVKVLSTAGTFIMTYGGNDAGFPYASSWQLILSLEVLHSAAGNFLFILIADGSREPARIQEWRVGNAQEPLTFVAEFQLERVGIPYMNAPQHLAVDSDWNIFVSYISEQAIQVYDGAGRFLRQFGAVGPEQERFMQPMGITVGPDGNLFVTDRAYRIGCGYSIQVYDPQGLFVGKWCTRAQPPFPPEGNNYTYATDVAFDPVSGDLYVLEAGGRIKRYTFKSTDVRPASWGEIKRLYR